MIVKSFISRYLTVFRIIAAIIAFALIGVLLWGANDLLGNPISYSIAKKMPRNISLKNTPQMGMFWKA